MKNKLRNIITISIFIVTLLFILLINILIPDKNISKSERRALKQFSDISIKRKYI